MDLKSLYSQRVAVFLTDADDYVRPQCQLE